MSEDEFYEVELKLQTDDPELLDRIWAQDQIGPFRVTGRRIQRQRNNYFDSPDRALDRARGNLRWRTFADSPSAELTYKGPAEVIAGS
jgi:adenylate cyclase class IV